MCDHWVEWLQWAAAVETESTAKCILVSLVCTGLVARCCGVGVDDSEVSLAV